MENDFEYMIKIVMIGDSGAGKTSLVARYFDNNLQMNHIATIGIDFKAKIVNIDGKNIKVQIWDTAGQEKFQTITSSFFRDTHGIVLTYAIDNENSFKNIDKWSKQIKENSPENVKVILVGNKNDLEDKRKITFEQGKKLADDYGYYFIECSALTGNYIKDVFEKISIESIKDLNKNEIPNIEEDILIKKTNKKKKKKCCK